MKRSARNNLIALIIPAVIIAGVVLAVVLKNYEVDKKMALEEIKLLDFYSEQEVDFLEKQGYLTVSVTDKITEKTTKKTSQASNPENTEANKEEIAKILKPPTLIEQNFNSSEESFEVLAAQFDFNNNVYKMAFKLENRSAEPKNFFLTPVSHEKQAVFKGVVGLITDVSGAQAVAYGSGVEGLELLAKLYDIDQHFSELKPELGQAYLDIRDKNYQVQPIAVAVLPNSAIVAQSEWEVLAEGENPEDDSFESIYLLVYGSAGGARDEVTILNVRSYAEENKQWAVDFFTRAISDLYIIPGNQATLDDGESVSLFCGNNPVQPQILEQNIIYYPEWSCFDIARIVYSFQKEDSHILRFVFGNEEKYAFNGVEAGSPPEADNQAGEESEIQAFEEPAEEEPVEPAESPEDIQAGPPDSEKVGGEPEPEPEPEIEGCTDSTATNYNSDAIIDDNSCEYPEPEIEGCIDAEALNYNPEATQDDGSCEYPIEGCTNSEALNYNPEATIDDESCEYSIEGCTDPEALNYNAEATVDDNTCEYEIYGCTDPEAENYNPEATTDDEGCLYAEEPIVEPPSATETDSPSM